MKQIVLIVLVMLLTQSGIATAQWRSQPDPRVPRTPEGKPILTAPAPRSPDGTPDLSGVWHVEGESLEEKRRLFGPEFGRMSPIGMEPEWISKYGVDILVDYQPGQMAMSAEADAIYQRRRQGQETSPTTLCLPAGIPRATLLSEAHKIVQTPGLILMMHELDLGMSRQIYTDGRSLPKEIEVPAWLGYSVGKWEGDTLVVESTGFNDHGWMDAAILTARRCISSKDIAGPT
jgi:hypothetical protein